MTHSEQLDLFTNPHQHVAEAVAKQEQRQRDQQVQKMILRLQDQFGKNSIIRAADLKDGAVARKRNKEIGGHQA